MIDWTHWHNEPFLIGGLIFLGWLYAILTGPWRDRLAPGPEIPLPGDGQDKHRVGSSQQRRYPRRHAVKFYAALVIFYLAVG